MKIDITKELVAFRKHLTNNERVILSAKFGDGKTYFLDEFKERFSKGKEYLTKYEFITLYPVNYQVSDNKEIFEYIKRDILIQMVLKGMVEPNCQISEAHYLQHYIMNNHLTLVQDIIQVLPSLGIGNEGLVWTGLMAGLSGLSFLNTQKEKYEQFKKDIESMDDIKLVEKFCSSFADQKGGCYELDLITEIIIQSIKKFKEEHKGTNVVLIIEDMDRLDPAHLFRLLNIFSAHLDRYNIYKKTEELSDYILSNKFGFDNIITVFDYDNTKDVFAHFYGGNANFEGYINKFISGNVFRYSINNVAKEKLNTLLKTECGVEFSDFKEKKLISEVCKKIYQVYQELSVRDIQKILSKYDENLSFGVYEFRTGIQIQEANSLTTLISILRLMGFEVEEIKRGILSLPDEVKLNCIGCYLFDMFEIVSGSFIYKGSYYSLKSDINRGPINSVEFKKHSSPIIGAMKIDEEKIDRSINKAFEHVL